MWYRCTHVYCELYRNCPQNYIIPVREHSEQDDAGMPLFFGTCESINRTISSIPFSEIKKEDITPPQQKLNTSVVQATGSKGFSKSSHRGDLYLGVQIERDGKHLRINKTRMEFRGTAIWESIDKLVDAYFDDKWADFSSKEWARLTSANGKQLRTFIERKPRDARKHGNQKYDPKARLKVN